MECWSEEHKNNTSTIIPYSICSNKKNRNLNDI